MTLFFAFLSAVTADINPNAVPQASTHTSSTSSTSSTNVPSSCALQYKVKAGESCYSIAVANSLDPAAVITLNPTVCGPNLPVDYVLCLSMSQISTSVAVPVSTNSSTTANNLAPSTATMQDTSTSALSAAASLITSSVSTAAAAPGVCAVQYTVQAGDSCYSVATARSLDPASVVLLNPTACGPNLPVGYVLCLSSTVNVSASSTIPVASTSATITVVPTSASVTVGPTSAVSLVSSSVASTSTAPAVPGTCALQYTVKSGDTCYSIATASSIDPASVVLLNPTACGPSLPVGYVLCLSAGISKDAAIITSTTTNSAAIATATACSLPHTVQSGETCYSIAAAKGIYPSVVVGLNPNVCGPGLQVGTVLCLSGSGAVPSATTGTVSSPVSVPTSGVALNFCNTTYTVQKGDTCFQIATSNNLDLNLLLQTNPGCSELWVGMIICISFNNPNEALPHVMIADHSMNSTSEHQEVVGLPSNIRQAKSFDSAWSSAGSMLDSFGLIWKLHNDSRSSYDNSLVPLTWNNSLSLNAQNIAHNASSACDYTITSAGYGINAFIYKSNYNVSVNASQVFEYWTSESEKSSFVVGDSKTYNHFSQVVSRTSTDVGCGYGVGYDATSNEWGVCTVMVCLYYPPGNMV